MAIIQSPFQPLTLPETSLFSFIFSRENRPFPEDHKLFQDAATEKSYSYIEIKRMAIDFGKSLKAHFRWQKGDVVAMFAANSIDWPAVVLGTLWAGGVVSPANPGYTAKELAYQLRDNAARVIITQFRLIDTVREALNIAKISNVNILIIDDIEKSTYQIPHFTTIRNKDPSIEYHQAEINPKNDLAFLVYSSGTTGKPKGVKLSHYNVTSNISQLQPGDQENLTWNGSKTCGDIPLPNSDVCCGGDTVLACVPFFHIYGLTKTIINSLFIGATTIILSKFEIEKWCSLVQEHRITFSYIVPPIVLLLCKHPAVVSYDLSSIRMANSGAATLSQELITACLKRTGIRVKQGYGMTETCPTVFNQRWDMWNTPIGSTGQLLPNMEAKICLISDADSPTSESVPLPQGEIGELYVRGPNVFLGYHNNPAATSASLSSTGWYRTGDVGYIDPRGNFFITDRVKELIKYKGFQVAPAELEAHLLEHPFIVDCAIVGVYSHELETELPRAYVVPKRSPVKNSDIDERSILEWFNTGVANHKKLRGGVCFVDSIPRSTSGKTLRKVLKEWVKSERNLTVRARL
ncbi:phenylacetyl-CoA ligase [Talaromyces proteolyticus]|uniref:Phenylacetyl-CoA ligase n=1 Tax=Talaromyces proteolyticus TaxID=1131652 RepID=A0AAD4PZ99_9EURO|nr:phenylacetyl-CoA ligase [Talaromyces proteolyticus]KAH8695547.1 phenylacetyl-CoA ligase [Talaromyces proteolyticus]